MKHTKLLLTAAAIALFTASGLLYWGSSFASNMIHDQLSEQKIVISDRATLEKAGEKGEILKYAGQTVDTGQEAKVYSEYIKGHIQKIANGKTYSEISAEYQKDRTNKTLEGQRMTLFMGETLRGLLLNAYGWGIVGQIAFYASIVIFVAATGVLYAALRVSTHQRVHHATHKVKKTTKKSRR